MSGSNFFIARGLEVFDPTVAVSVAGYAHTGHVALYVRGKTNDANLLSEGMTPTMALALAVNLTQAALFVLSQPHATEQGGEQ